jgi:hypothetical protein
MKKLLFAAGALITGISASAGSAATELVQKL